MGKSLWLTSLLFFCYSMEKLLACIDGPNSADAAPVTLRELERMSQTLCCVIALTMSMKCGVTCGCGQSRPCLHAVIGGELNQEPQDSGGCT